jgi:deferrochelatase/peroxidase EfeB
VVPASEILVGQPDDTSVTRPAWAKDGSFLVFRQLKQLVPEFNKFLADNPIVEPGLTPEQGSELLGARMVGRWKSVGCRRSSMVLKSTNFFGLSSTGRTGRAESHVRRSDARKG